MFPNPFEGLSLPEIYGGLLDGRFGPRWPDEKLQKGYTGTCGVDLLRRAFQFIEMLERDGAFKTGWRGLDYGCGWGRFLSTLRSKGTASQMDGCDAWAKTLGIISDLGYPNHVFKVSELLLPDEIAESAYDFIMTFSVFTHLSPRAFDQNIPVLLSGLAPGGRLYMTVRHDEFINHKYKDRSDELGSILARTGIVFLDSGGDLTGEKIFGDTIVARDYLDRYGKVRYLGQPHPLQHVYAIDR